MRDAFSPESFRSVSAGFLLPLASARSLRIAALAAVAVTVIIATLRAVGLLTSESLDALRRAIPVVAVPIAAALLAELPIREGLTHRTLLYPLLGPVSRGSLALGRTLWTVALVALGALVASTALYLMTADRSGAWGRECLAILLGAYAYVALFGLLHLVSQRGLVTALALYFLVDQPLAQLPFSIRMLAPSFHVGSVLGRSPSYDLPIAVDSVSVAPVVSALVLLGAASLAIAWTMRLFSRRDLPELCG